MEKNPFSSAKRIKVVLSYDGTSYSGWQRQEGLPTIQETLEKAFSQILREKIFILGASRTDAGVHALSQTAHFDMHSPFDLKKLFYSVNCVLPKDIKILSLEEVSSSFHARYKAKKKLYHYYLELAPFSSPFSHAYSIPIYSPFDLSLVEKGASYFVGKQDFTSFTNDASKGAAKINPVRTIYQIEIKPTQRGVFLRFEGDGFLYKMIRNIMGTLILVGKKKMAPEEIPTLLGLKDRRKAPSSAPAKALFLVKVYYDELQTSSYSESDPGIQNDRIPLEVL